MPEKPIVSIVLGAYNRLEFLKLAIQSAREETQNIPHEIIVVDGGSNDGSIEWLVLQKDVITIIQHNRGEFDGKPIPRRPWGYFMNLAFKSAQADYILMMSDDTIFHPNAIQNAMDFIKEQQAQGKKVGAVPFYFNDIGYEEPTQYKVHTLFGQPLLNHGIYIKDAFSAVGFADDVNYEFYASDSDICLKLIHAGYAVLPCKTALMLHCPNHPTRYMTTSSAQWVKDATALLKKWRGIFVDDKMTIEDIQVVNDYIEFTDPHNLAKRFDEVLKQSPETTRSLVGNADDVLLGQIDSRLSGILAKVTYIAQVQDQTNRQHAVEHLDWLAFWNQWQAFNRPYYRRVLSTWAIFAPLRWLKNRLKG